MAVTLLWWEARDLVDSVNVGKKAEGGGVVGDR